MLKEQHIIWFLKNYQLLIKMVQKEKLLYYQMILMQLPLNLAKNMTRFILRKKDHTTLRFGAAALGTGMGNTLSMERVLYLGGAVVEPKGIIKNIVTKINISKINKLYKPTIHVACPTKATAEQLKPHNLKMFF